MAKKNITREKELIAVLMGDPRLPDKVKKNGKFNPEDLAVVERLKSELKSWQRFDFIYLDEHASMFEKLEKLKDKPLLAVNFCDEGYFNEPTREGDIPLWLDQHNMPFSGSGADCLKICYDKMAVSKLADKLGIPTPKQYGHPKSVKTADFPVILKPRYGDGGQHITADNVVYTQEKLKARWGFLDQVLPTANRILIQQFLSGQELTCGIIGNQSDFSVLPIGEEDYSCLPANLPLIQGYEAKWDDDSPYWAIQTKLAEISGIQKRQIVMNSKRLFIQLGCRDYARFDWRLDHKGIPNLLEVNPNPGWCHDGHLAALASLAGRSYLQLLQSIIRSALRRYGFK